MPLEVIRIDQVQLYETVRVQLATPSNFKLFNFLPSIKGFFRRRGGMAPADNVSLNPRAFNRSFGSRKFLGLVIENDTVNQRIKLEIKTPPQDPETYYHLTIPYRRIFKMARLVRNVVPLDAEAEARRRRQTRGLAGGSGEYFHPFDRFVPVKLIALPGGSAEMQLNFTFTVPSTGTAFTVTLPATGILSADYVVVGNINTLPMGGAAALLVCPEAARTATTFDFSASGSLTTGTTIDFIVAERS